MALKMGGLPQHVRYCPIQKRSHPRQPPGVLRADAASCPGFVEPAQSLMPEAQDHTLNRGR